MLNPLNPENTKEKRIAQSNHFLELYKQGNSYQKIGNMYGLSRERVGQILNRHTSFRKYQQEQKEAKAYAKAEEERKKAEQEKENLYSRSLAVLYPERVAELWDHEKNGELKPDNILANTSTQFIWLKCPIDGHSWKKKPNDITTSWSRSGTTGCPLCAGKRKKAKKQPTLIEVYPELISQYWNYEKNRELGLDPKKNTLGSNKKAWFKCPHDGNEWQASIASTIQQQWSKDNAGCQVCNGTDTRKQAKWKRRNPIAVEFPDQLEKYWCYKINKELNLDPMKLTVGSSKEAFFKCPIDGHEWVARITAIKGSWKKGNSGCPQCRGFVVAEKTSLTTKGTSLIALYPDYVAQYWDYEKNNELGLEPDKLTKGSQKEAFFKCPIDGYEWITRIGSITRASWSKGNSGCACCGSGWTSDVIRQFVASLENHIPNLTQAELYKIFEQSGILSTKNIDAKLTIIICPLDTIPNWHGEIKHVFPNSRVTIKSFNPYWIDIEDGNYYIILNHEMFQQPSTAMDIKLLLERYQIDLIVVDEIHRCKQRAGDPSKRRQMVLALITNATEKNPDLHVLGMSATPVINNLKEGKSLVELVTGLERSDLGEKATINNCMSLHQAFVTLGIRSKVKPKLKISRIKLPVDCTHLVDEIREEGTSILKMEQILTRARIPIILQELKPKTIIYTHYVKGIADQLKEAIEAAGWTVDFHVGGDKSGRNDFINGSTDILIASSAMAVGVDGFQKVCDLLNSKFSTLDKC